MKRAQVTVPLDSPEVRELQAEINKVWWIDIR
jgi:hypothetical protein